MKIRRVRQWFVATLLVACLALVSLIGVVGAPRAMAQDATTQAAGQDMTPVEVVEHVAPAVVTVYNLQTVQDGLGQIAEEPQGAGTGFIIDEEGHIVTNWHVVSGGDQLAVVLEDGTRIEAELIGTDPRDDLAVVKIDPASVPAFVNFGSSDDLKPGQPVLAIGSPLGAFTNTVTQGIVSAIGRNELGSGSVCQNYSNLIQHDAAINPGNSGGPLFNLKGEVIGVNTLGIPLSNGGVPVQGLFFAVPSSTVTVAVQQLIETGQVAQPYIGVTFQPLDPTLATTFDLPTENGIYVIEVAPDSPAATAGLQADDIITEVDGTEISVENSLADIMFNYQPGDTITLTVIRGSEETSVELTLDQAPESLLQACTLEGQP